MKPSTKPNSENDHPQVEISCPHCGGTTGWKLLQTLNPCSYCGSVLSWPYPKGEPDYLIAESVIRKEADLLDVLAMYDAMRVASLRRGAMRQAAGDQHSDISFDIGAGFTDTGIYEIKRERLPLFRILKSYCVYAPYQLISCLLAFHVLGRGLHEQKVFRTLFFTLDAILPGYGDEWNFRDKGLQTSKQKLKSLASYFENKSKTLGSMRGSEQFIATDAITQKVEKITRQWTNQRRVFESEIQPICFTGSVVESHRWWVYRPYYFVNAQTPGGPEWFLVDGQFGTIAGTPTSHEITMITRGGWKKLDLQTVRRCDVRVIPFRCPNCGWDIKVQKSIFQICENCSRLLDVNEDQLRIVPYHTVSSKQLQWWPKQHKGPAVWLPFWRMEPSLLFEKKNYEDMSELFSVLVPAVKQNGSQRHFYIPAFESWPIVKYDKWAFDFGATLSNLDISHCETNLHNMKSSKDRVLLPVITREMVESLFPYIVAQFAPAVLHARLNTLLIQRLAKAHALLKHLQLVFVPAALSESKGSEPKLLGPKQSIDWIPLKEGTWPPVMQRSVRRSMAQRAKETSETGSKPRSKWLKSLS